MRLPSGAKESARETRKPFGWKTLLVTLLESRFYFAGPDVSYLDSRLCAKGRGGGGYPDFAIIPKGHQNP